MKKFVMKIIKIEEFALSKKEEEILQLISRGIRRPGRIARILEVDKSMVSNYLKQRKIVDFVRKVRISHKNQQFFIRDGCKLV